MNVNLRSIAATFAATIILPIPFSAKAETVFFEAEFINADQLLLDAGLSTDPLSGSFEYDNSVPPTLSFPNQAFFNDAATSLSFSNTDGGLKGTGGAGTAVISNGPIDNFAFTWLSATNGLLFTGSNAPAGYKIDSFVLELFDFDGDALTDLSLPENPPDPTDFTGLFEGWSALLFFEKISPDSDGPNLIIASYGTLFVPDTPENPDGNPSLVPVPPSLPLLAASMMGLLGLRRFKKS